MSKLDKINQLKEQMNKTDRCVICSKDTSIPKHYPVDSRLHYVEGAGQLCSECWIKVYGE